MSAGMFDEAEYGWAATLVMVFSVIAAFLVAAFLLAALAAILIAVLAQ